MDTRKNFDGGEIEITNDELDLMPNANRQGLFGINDGIGDGSDMIISGVNAIINAGTDVSVSDGFIFLNGEMIKVDAQIVPRTVGTDLYQFAKVVTNNIAEWDRNYRDATTHNVLDKIRAIPTNVAVITGLSVVGNTMLDVMKSLIQIQSDWNQADNTEPDFIKNKPSVVDLLLQGSLDGIDVGGAGAIGSVGGGITSASILNSANDDTRIRVNFSSIGTSNYHPIITLLSEDPNWDLDNDVYCMVRNLTPTSFEVLFKEEASNPQDLKLLISVIPF